MNLKLYEIANKYEELLDLYNSAETEEAQNEALAKLQELEGAKDEKLHACCAWYRGLRAQADTIKSEIDRLTALRDAAEKKAEGFERYIGSCVGEGTKWANSLFSISWRRSEAVKVLSEKDIPDVYMKEYYAPDKLQLKTVLQRLQKEGKGQTIPGVELEVRQNLQLK
jgi:hypothetical protein